MMALPPRSLSLLILIAYLLSHCFSQLASDAQLIPENEVKVLQKISEKLKNSLWMNISQNSCTADGGRTFNKSFEEKVFSNVTYDCSFSKRTVCHITLIQLKGLNLSGVLPAEFGNLPHLKVLDLSKNYVNGKIPTSFAKIPLTNLSLVWNNNSGSIPDEIGQIFSLEELILEDNNLGGKLPASLGKLTNLRRIVLSGNNFFGRIPETFSNLKNLTELRISGNNISGMIPGFIGNFTNLNTLEIQGTSLQGPIPSSFNLLTNLQYLIISDLDTPNLDFPNLSNLKKLLHLVLRNCSITGQIPHYIQSISDLKLLDLSNNHLSGPVPNSMGSKINYVFLTNNSLSGSLPSWINDGGSRRYYDLSYNNFTGSSPSNSCKEQQHVNLISSFPNEENSQDSWCFKKNLPCPNRPKYNSLFINCGGSNMPFKGNEYEADSSYGGPSTFIAVENKWAYSNTGIFWKNEDAHFLAEDTSKEPNLTSIYKTARGSPLSLKYYGLCMRKGSYNVTLHFAEIMFSVDQYHKSNARRIFDVAIQGNVVLNDFNIAAEAGGPSKPVIKSFNNVYVDSGTLEIHLYWTGKGTTSIPQKGTYGPLISAITVTPNFRVGLSSGAIIGIVLASFVILVLGLVIIRERCYMGGKYHGNQEFQGLNTGYFTLRQIKAATNDFNLRNKIGEGGFGPVYKGILQDGRVIAVKQLSSKSRQGNREFVNEIGMISALNHPNLVKLYGCCIEGKQLLLVYEYMENNSLAHALFGEENKKLLLNWQTRKAICLGIAKGLAYLHEGSRLKIVHRDIKATNVLLDKDLNAKISDFGLARLHEEEDTHINTRIAGTIGYMAPEYATRGYLTDKADVYSFGVVVLEIISGKTNAKCRPKQEFVYLLDWAYVLQEEGNILDLVDPSLGSDYSQEEALMLVNLALLCTNPSPTLRPTMSSVVSMINGQLPILPLIVKSGGNNEELRFKALDKLSQDDQAQVPGSSKSFQVEKSISTDCPWTNSSTSMQREDDTKQSSNTSRLLVGIDAKLE